MVELEVVVRLGVVDGVVVAVVDLVVDTVVEIELIVEVPDEVWEDVEVLTCVLDELLLLVSPPALALIRSAAYYCQYKIRGVGGSKSFTFSAMA